MQLLIYIPPWGEGVLADLILGNLKQTKKYIRAFYYSTALKVKTASAGKKTTFLTQFEKI